MGDLEGRYSSGDPSLMRVSDADRHKVADVLRQAAGEGRLDLDELDERLELAFGAKTYADLVPITADLHLAPATDVPATRLGPQVPAGPGHNSSVAIMGECNRRGVWHVPPTHSAFSLMGSVVLDLREAVLSTPHTTINASAIMGEVQVKVPAHVHVIVDGTPIMGDYGQGKDKVPARVEPGAPTIHIKGVALMGSVSVTRLPPPGTPKKFLGTY